MTSKEKTKVKAWKNKVSTHHYDMLHNLKTIINLYHTYGKVITEHFPYLVEWFEFYFSPKEDSNVENSWTWYSFLKWKCNLNLAIFLWNKLLELATYEWLTLTLFFQFIYLFIFGCVGSSFLCKGFLQLRRAGATLHRGARASHCRGLSRCGAQAPDAQAQ